MMLYCSELIPVVQYTLASVRRVASVTVPLISVNRLFLVHLSRVLVWSSCFGIPPHVNATIWLELLHGDTVSVQH